MRVCFITGFTPAVENIRGVSAHPYYLLKYRPKNVEVKMITYDINRMGSTYIKELGENLNIECFVQKMSKSVRLRNFRLGRFLSRRGVLDYITPSKETIKEIESFRPDVIWTYPNFFFNWSYILPNYKFVHSAPDSNVLGSAREFVDTFFHQSLLRRMMMNFWYQKSINNDSLANSDNSLIHFVGMDDLRMYRKSTNGDNGFFLLHPHYILKDKEIRFGKILTVLVAGKFDKYMKSGIEDIIHILSGNPYKLKENIFLTFLGKGWEPIVNNLKVAGFKCKQISWVDNYIDEIIKYDIQLTPITVGTGTKGKVLDAIGNGLLCIGTKYALENIAVRDKESCLLYKDPYEVPAILNSIVHNRAKYEYIAEKGREQVRKYHNPARISKRFFGIIGQHFNIQ